MGHRGAVVAMVVTALTAACGGHDDPTAAVRGALAPDGRLRAGVTVGNPVLAMRDVTGGDPAGVAVDVAREIGRRLNVDVVFVTYDSAAAMADAAATGAWAIAFLAADPARAGAITFTPPYLELEATYLVPAGSRIQSVEEVDVPGARVAARPRSAYDLYLRRSLSHTPGPDVGIRIRILLQGLLGKLGHAAYRSARIVAKMRSKASSAARWRADPARLSSPKTRC